MKTNEIEIVTTSQLRADASLYSGIKLIRRKKQGRDDLTNKSFLLVEVEPDATAGQAVTQVMDTLGGIDNE
jgi:hypothetical protein